MMKRACTGLPMGLLLAFAAVSAAQPAAPRVVQASYVAAGSMPRSAAKGPAPASSAAAQPAGDTPSAAVAGDAPFYTLHPGDVVSVTFRYTPEFNDEVTVQPDGRVSLKATGDIRAAGYTLPELERAIVRDSTAKLVNPDVSVSVKEFERPRFVVAGEVQLPARFELRQPTTVLQAILLAGGPKEDSAMNHVYLFRRLNATDAEVHVLQLSKYDGRTRAKNDLLLQPDDMVLVQRDALEKIGRIVKLFNLGIYVSPIPQNANF